MHNIVSNSSFQPKPRKIFNNIKWQNLIFSLIQFENLQKLEYSKSVSYVKSFHDGKVLNSN